MTAMGGGLTGRFKVMNGSNRCKAVFRQITAHARSKKSMFEILGSAGSKPLVLFPGRHPNPANDERKRQPVEQLWQLAQKGG